MGEGVVIIGAGQAGATAAATLRQLHYAGPIVLLGEENTLPYERPPLSKDVLSGARSLDQAQVQPPAFYQDNGIDVRLGTPVTALDAARRTVSTASGEVLRYDHCVLATGGRARQLAGLGAGPRVHYLRSADDAQRLREAMAGSRSLAVLGAGFLGMEVASTARSLGIEVTVFESAPRVLQRALPPLMAQWLEARAGACGVRLLKNVRTPVISPSTDGVRISVPGGEELAFDLLLVAIGQEADAAVARQAGLAISATNGGILVDERCATSAERIYAVGDCTSRHGAGHADTRLESWQNAVEQAKAAAAAIAGSAKFAPWTPWFWTDQFDCNIQMLGDPVDGLSWAVRGSLDAQPPKFILLGTDAHGELKQAIAVNCGGELRQMRPLLEQAIPCDVGALCDTGTPLRQLVRTMQSAPAGRPHLTTTEY